MLAVGVAKRELPFRRRACARRQVIFRASFRKIAGWRQAKAAPSTGWPSSTPTIRTNPVWRHAELLLAREGNAGRERNGAQRVRVAEGSHLTPHVRASEGRALGPARDRIFSRAMMGGETFILLKAALLGPESAKQAACGCFADNFIDHALLVAVTAARSRKILVWVV